MQALCAAGAQLDYQVYEGADHRGSVLESLPAAQEFADRVIAGEDTPVTCTA